MGAGVLTVLLLVLFFAFQSGSGPSGTDSHSQPTRLVVLPFDNLGLPEDEYFADGMTEEITMRLASLSGMAVISQNTAVQYKNTNKTIEQIGSELGVNYVLGGSVRWDKRSGDAEMVRITPRLIRVSDDTNVWTETYERAIEGIFAIQSEIARQVSSKACASDGSPHQRRRAGRHDPRPRTPPATRSNPPAKWDQTCDRDTARSWPWYS